MALQAVKGFVTDKTVLRINSKKERSILFLKFFVEQSIRSLYKVGVEVISIGWSVRRGLINGDALVSDYSTAGLEAIKYRVLDDNIASIIIELNKAVELVFEVPKINIL